MAKQRVIRHKSGAHTFYLKPVESGALMMALSQSDKPQVPIVEVTYAGGTIGSEASPNDPNYIKSLRDWNAQYNSRLFRLCVVYGIEHVETGSGDEANPSSEDLASLRFLYGSEIPSHVLKYYWYAQILGNTSAGFMSLVLGQTHITDEELQADEDRFRSDDPGSGIRGEGDGVSSDVAMADGISD
jgi:hypothetical protein